MENIVVVGQIARDLVLVVDAVPDAGGTADVRERREMLGGKGANIAVGLAQLGASASLVGVVGDDEMGERLVARAAADGVDVSAVVRRAGCRSGLIVDVVADGWRYLEDLPDGVLLRPGDVPDDLVAAADSVIVQLQQPPEVAVRVAQAARGRVVLDGAPPVGCRAELLARADVVRADHREAEAWSGGKITGAGDAVEAARRLDVGLVAFAVDGVGNAFVWDGGELVLPLDDADVVDTTGGGDAFVAALTFALTRGDSPREAARLAVRASGSVVTRPGGRPDLTGPGLRV